ncbi:LOW QUALITY PROTEIN: trafficking protein particle complex subunit 11-like [Pollicipes pollicipes]|uniref:LOW QUALITY PROTEIN: trafficking protein particle complex subunit 11-like n=1 Tax=Pollicipes pollicipes TaxID=41117 RepID=UPI001884C790|nr:LOW QUALITY PROTEIN: trafficking protein particle complex subunit 11-like [Pollicipes pollicipes]
MASLSEKAEIYLSSLDLPEELKQVPQANVGFVGLDPKNNETHKHILDAFTASRKTDRLSIHYSVIAADKDFPPAKPKRTTYEWFLPKGILKRRWMKKHLFELPAVVIIFFDLDWSDAAWNEKKLECSSRVKAIRAALTTQQTRLAVVLVQRAASGDDPQAADRAADLCAVCDLPPKSLWVLPATDHLSQYAMRLESAFYELAQTYYHQRVKVIRAHRELLNKSHHQALFVRHQFKLGFFCEVRQDMPAAHKAYQQAYSHLLELRTTDLTLCEIKVVAAMLSFKVCRLAFRQNLPRDAIAHFRRHVELFRPRVGPAELTVEHSGWLGQQYQWFGEVFEQAIQMGLPAIQTQHPGIYFEQAALHGRRRREAATALQLEGASYPEPDPLASIVSTDFYGQRPWRPPGRNVELMDTQREKLGVLAIQLMERAVNHHNLVIPLLSCAISHYKKYHCPRMKERLMVQMAEEYALSGDHDKAVILLGKVLLLYRSERWWPLVAQVAWLGLRSAYLSCQVAPYLAMCAALLSPAATGAQAERARLDANLHRLLRREPPEPEPGCSVQPGWTEALASPDPVTLELPGRHAVVSCQPAFSAPRFEQGRPLQVELRLQNLTSRRTLSVEVPARLEELGSVVWLEAVALQLEGGAGLDVLLSWKISLGDEELHQSMFGLPVGEPRSDVGGLCTTVVPRPARLALAAEHQPPVLVGEVYQMTARMTCDDLGGPLTDLVLELSLLGADEETAKNTFVVHGDTSRPLTEPLQLACGAVQPRAVAQQLLGLQCLTPASRQLQLAARYSEPTEAGTCQGRAVHAVHARGRAPVPDVGEGGCADAGADRGGGSRPNGAAHPPDHQHGPAHGPTALHTADHGRYHFDVAAESDEESGQEDEEEGGDGGSLRELVLQPMESASECVVVTARQLTGHAQPGTYTVTWNRLDWDGRPVSTVAPAPALQVRPRPLLVSVSLPAHGVVRTPLPVRYTVTNHSPQVFSLLLHMEASEAFMFSGNKRYQFRVVPGGSRQLVYNLYPLLSGRVTLPRPRLTLYRDGAPVEATELIDGALRHLPTHVYVLPQEKGGPHGPAGGAGDQVRTV